MKPTPGSDTSVHPQAGEKAPMPVTPTAPSTPGTSKPAVPQPMTAEDTDKKPTEELGDIAHKAKQEGEKLGAQAAETVQSHAAEKLDTAKDKAADHLSHRAEMLREDAGDTGFKAEARRAVADAMDDVSSGLRGQTIGDLGGQLRATAKQNPALVLGGAALLGFAAARLMTASDPKDRRS